MPVLHTLENINNGPGSLLVRLRVEGGWLYRAVEWDSDTTSNTSVGYSVALCFVPDTPAQSSPSASTSPDLGDAP